MNWQYIWSVLEAMGGQFAPEFRQWIETQYDVTQVTPTDFPELAKVVQEDYKSWQRIPQPYQDAQGGWWYDKPIYDSLGRQTGTMPTPYTPPKTEKPEKQPAQYQISEDGNFYVDENGLTHLTDQGKRLLDIQDAQAKAEADAAAQAADLQAQQAALDAEQKADYQKGMSYGQGIREGAKTAAGSEYATNLQAYKDFLASQNTGPAGWINYWKAQQVPPPTPNFAGGTNAPVAGSAAEAAQKGMTTWVSPEQLAGAQSPVQQGWSQGAQTYQDPTTGQVMVWDMGSGGYRPETPAETQWRTQTVPMRDIQRGYYGQGVQEVSPYTTALVNRWQGTPGAQAKLGGRQGTSNEALSLATFVGQPVSQNAASQITSWSPGQGASLPSTVNPLTAQGLQRIVGQNEVEWARENRQPMDVGPQAPMWSRAVVNPTRVGNQYQINLNTLKNTLAPVSAQRWAAWAPSEQQGYLGLVGEANPKAPEDWWANVENMWRASRPGQLASQRVRSY